MLFPSLRAYHTSTKITTGFTPFHLVHDVESVLPIECQIPSLRLHVELLPDTSPLEEHLLLLKQTNKDCRTALQAIEAAKTRSKSHFDSHIHPHTFIESNLVLVYDQSNDKFGKGKLESMWYVPYVVYHYLEKGAYIRDDFDGYLFKNPHNGLYLKRFYA